jgi:hypothetical protein
MKREKSEKITKITTSYQEPKKNLMSEIAYK